MYNNRWIEEYRFLEEVRQSGVVNMIDPQVRMMLIDNFDISTRMATAIHVSFIENYRKLVADGIISVNKTWGNSNV